jgi:hypothetical protein
MIFIFGIGVAIFFALIIAIIFTLGGDNKPGDSNFTQKFTTALFVIIIIVIIGSVLEMAGCSNEDEPDYPMKYERF